MDRLKACVYGQTIVQTQGHNMKKLFYIIIILSLPCVIYAAPNPTGTSGIWSHGETVQITCEDSSFGAKSPAAPVIWDDCESGSITDLWTKPLPDSATGSYDMAYRTETFRTVDAPHGAGDNSRFAGGGHDPAGYDPYNGAAGPNVGLWTTDVSGYSKIYISCYTTLDPSFPWSPNNIKNMETGSGSPPYGGSQAYWPYSCFNSGVGWAEWGSNCDMGYLCQQMDEHPEIWAIGDYVKVWHKREFITQDGSFCDIYLNNVIKWDTGSCDPISFTPAYFGIGGYYRKTAAEDGDPDAWRYYDDIYVDTTFSRVMLGNASTYSSCTVLEPQPPTAWSTSSITVTVNEGKLHDDPGAGESVYVYVFNANNEHNTNGLEVTLGEGGSTPTITGISVSGGVGIN